MPKVNLRDYHPWCKHDEFVHLSDATLEAVKAFDRKEAAYKRRMY